MEEGFELFKNPFDGLSDYERFIEECRKIARKLFNNFVITFNTIVVK